MMVRMVTLDSAIDPVGFGGVGAEDDVDLGDDRIDVVLDGDVAPAVLVAEPEAKELGRVVAEVAAATFVVSDVSLMSWA